MSPTPAAIDRAARLPRTAPARVLLALTAALALLLGITPVTSLLTGAEAATCPCTIFGDVVPGTPSNSDTNSVEVGIKFRASEAGSVAGIRFYKGSANTGTHTGSLWTRDGQRLATGTFSGETATGWQTLTFTAPVAIAAGTTYVASYYAPRGGYAVAYDAMGSGVTSGPLRALANGEDGANGVYRYGTGGGFPTNTYRSSNYFVDVVFSTAGPDTVPPTVAERSPADTATGVPVTSAVTATFNEDVKSGSVAFTVTGAEGAPVAGATSYDSGTRTATFKPSASMATSTTHQVSVTAQDLADNAMTSPATWSFTTSSSPDGCPCSLWPNSATPAVPAQADDSAVELGVKFRPDVDGFIRGVRFYKGSGNTGTHTGSLWSTNGSRLATATFTNESATGWQTVTFTAPVAVTANTTYVASYFAPVGRYAIDSGYFASSGHVAAPLRALANNVEGGNGVYRYGSSGFPSSSWNSANYWVDVVFSSSGTDTIAPTVTGHAPASGENGVATTAVATATWSEAVQPSTVSFTLSAPSGAGVDSTVTYSADTRTSTLTPKAPLAANTTYTAVIGGAEDAAGNSVSGSTTWSFTTGAPPAPIGSGPGGPVLVVTSPSNPFTGYTGEILRTEGLTAFATADVSSIGPDLLAQYDVVLLGSTGLTSQQVSTLTTWVEGGGNLIAFKPDKQLAPLLGLATTSGTRADGYLQVDTTAAPGRGITPETIQYHGVADLYTTDGATTVATIFSDATSTTTNPAVTLRSVGTSGGQAAAFTYDLPRSVVYTRQGNPAWDGQERDGYTPVRSDDLYFGGSGANDYIDLSKVAIPQADEQQRLLGNLIQSVNTDRKPLPRFWYFPRGAKAVVVNTGDDHAEGGTAGRFDQLQANSSTECAAADWECLRSTSYIYPHSPISNNSADLYDDRGFEIGLHPDTGCADYTPSSLAGYFSNQLSAFRSKYTSIPSPPTNRTHCLVWSDWSSQATVERDNGIRLDTTYYYWPGNWVQGRPGFMTGSGMPMRFAQMDGSMVDVYQAPTQMTDESDQAYPFTSDEMFRKAVGDEGYYGAFVANMHTNKATIPENDELISSALSYGVPMVSSAQMLEWLDGRNASTFTGISWSDDRLSFGLTVGSGARGLTAMLPIAGPGGSLSALTRNGAALPYRIETLKGVTYAVFDAAAGDHVATYAQAPVIEMTAASLSTTSVDGGGSVLDQSAGRQVRAAGSGTGGTVLTAAEATAAPALQGVTVEPLADGSALVRWTTAAPSTSRVEFGLVSGRLNRSVPDNTLVSQHAVTLTDLEPHETYFVRAVSRNAAGTGRGEVIRFVQPGVGVTDSKAASFRMGASDGYLGQGVDGELLLQPAEGAEFSTTDFPSTWERSVDGRHGIADALGGRLRIDGAAAGPRALYSSGRTLEFSATFSGVDGQYAGLAAGKDLASPYAMFALEGGSLVAKVNAPGVRTVAIANGSRYLGAANTYAIRWDSGKVQFSINGQPVATVDAAPRAKLRPLAWDDHADGRTLDLQYLRLSGYRGTSTYTSRVHDAQAMVTWDRVRVDADVPAGAKVAVQVRTGSTRSPDASWSGWRQVDPKGGILASDGRYAQYRLDLSTTAPDRSPVVHSVSLTHNGEHREHVGETGGPQA